MPEGERVELFVNPTDDTAVIPDVAGMTAEEARQALEAAGFRVVDTVIEQSDDVAEGHVIRTDPAEGEEVGVQDRITMFVAGAGATGVHRGRRRSPASHRRQRAVGARPAQRRRARGRGHVLAGPLRPDGRRRHGPVALQPGWMSGATRSRSSWVRRRAAAADQPARTTTRRRPSRRRPTQPRQPPPTNPPPTNHRDDTAPTTTQAAPTTTSAP